MKEPTGAEPGGERTGPVGDCSKTEACLSIGQKYARQGQKYAHITIKAEECLIGWPEGLNKGRSVLKQGQNYAQSQAE